jgi:uncharacterized membrane protein
MIEMVLQYTLYGLGIFMGVLAIVLGIIGLHNLSGALRKMRGAQAEGQHIDWYSYSSTLASIGSFLLSPAFLLVAISTLLPLTGSALVILRLVLLVIALACIGSGLFFIIRGRRLSQSTSMLSKRQ